MIFYIFGQGLRFLNFMSSVNDSKSASHSSITYFYAEVILRGGKSRALYYFVSSCREIYQTYQKRTFISREPMEPTNQDIIYLSEHIH